MSSDDPNGTRWSRAADGYGKTLLRKSGWSEGDGLGKDKGGATAHVTVRRKDDVMGLGYRAAVQETWTTQSVGFADVLARIKRRTGKNSNGLDKEEEDDDSSTKKKKKKAARDDDDDETAAATRTTVQPAGSRRHAMYAKRHAMQTELLHSRDARTQHTHEILGAAAAVTATDNDDDDDDGATRARRKRTRSRDDDSDDDDERSRHRADASTLRSPLLRRLMDRCPAHEPRATVSREDADASVAQVTVTKPQPRPPRCTATPFCL